MIDEVYDADGVLVSRRIVVGFEVVADWKVEDGGHPPTVEAD